MKSSSRVKWVGVLLVMAVMAAMYPGVSTHTVTADIDANPHIFKYEFSSTQGKDGWWYQYYNGTYQNMNWVEPEPGVEWWTGNEDFLLIGDILHPEPWLHPGASADAVVKWDVQEGGGLWNIEGTVSDFGGSCGGDGVNAKILHVSNGTSSVIWSKDIADDGEASHDLDRWLLPGDALYFIVNKKANNSCDTTGWNPTITKFGSLPSPLPDTYSFSEGFSGIQGENQWYYRYYDWYFSSGLYDMEWDDNAYGGSWGGSQDLCLISKTGTDPWVHPDYPCKAAIAWQAPKAGEVMIQGHMDRYSLGGDGVATVIKKNDSQIWPSSGAQVLGPRLAAQHIVTADVEAGDFIYFLVGERAENSYDTTNWNPKIMYEEVEEDWAPVTLDKLVQVADPADFAKLGQGLGKDVFMDSSLSTVYQGPGTDNHWYHSWGALSAGGVHSKMHGPLGDPMQTRMYSKNNGDFYDDEGSFGWGWWINNIYEDDDGLLAFCHLEKGEAPVEYGIGLAYSDDNGLTFERLGQIIGQFENSAVEPNIMGVPYIIRWDESLQTDFFYIYYNEYDPQDDPFVAVARANMEDVIDAAEDHGVTEWKKFYYVDGCEADNDLCWQQPGLGGNASPVCNEWGCIPGELVFPTIHGDAAYSTTKQKYILGGNAQGGSDHFGIWISFSNNERDWGDGIMIQQFPNDQERMAQYVTIVNTNGSDNGEVGNTFYLYWGLAKEWDPSSPQSLKRIFRQKVTLR